MRLAFAAACAAIAMPASAQNEAPRRTRVGIGPQLVPAFPGADATVVRPFLEFSRARGDEPFAFEAADESTGFALYRRDGFAIGPALSFEGERSRDDVGGVLPKVGFTVEAGGFIQYALAPSVRLRAEARHGIGGHRGVVGMVSADYVARDGDRWLVAVGPRATFADGRYHRAYFGVAAPVAGLAAFRPSGGLLALGATAGALRQLTARWGLFGYAKYDRLSGDAADSPVTRRFGSRDQWSGGLGVSYTFGRGVR